MKRGKTTSAKDFVMRVITQDYDAVRQAIAAGFDVNTPVPGMPIVESAIPAADPLMLRILWEAGAKPTSPFLQELFVDFENDGDGSAILNPKPPKLVGRFVLHRYCGDEEFSVVAATLYPSREGKASRLCFKVETDGVCVKSLPDTAKLKARPNAEITLTGKGLAPDKLVGKSFSVPRGYNEKTEGYVAMIYYADHADLDENEIKILSKKGKTFRVRWTGITQDMNHYDGSKPKTRVEIEATFTLDESA